ncbi:MAG: ATP-binding protein [Blautia massiliensis (ex Durand et al. 2017)]
MFLETIMTSLLSLTAGIGIGILGSKDNRATGIGLYLSRKILRKLGHEITVDSQVDKGTEVRMSLWKKDLEMY